MFALDICEFSEVVWNRVGGDLPSACHVKLNVNQAAKIEAFSVCVGGEFY